MEPKTISQNWKLVAVIYGLLRDHLPAGTLEREIEEADAMERNGVTWVKFSNPWLAEYAQDISRRLLPIEFKSVDERTEDERLVREAVSEEHALREVIKIGPETVREACRKRKPLDGTDAQCLEHALTITENERDTHKRHRLYYQNLAGEVCEIINRAMGPGSQVRSGNPHEPSVQVQRVLEALLAKHTKEAK